MVTTPYWVVWPITVLCVIVCVLVCKVGSVLYDFFIELVLMFEVKGPLTVHLLKKIG